jgi:glycosyltransferase involved in cell wall biosynthesis
MMSSRPRILALFGARVIFGAERENIESLAALREQGCEVLCLVRHEDWNDQIPAALGARGLAWRKVPYIDGWLPGWRMRIMLRNPIAFIVGNWLFLSIARKFRPTHVHAFNPFYILNFLAALVLMRTPLIYRAGEKPVIHRWVWRMLWRFVIARTCCFVPVSSFIAGELKATGVKAERIDVIHGVPSKRLATAMLSAMPPPEDLMRDIVFVGQITEAKGPHLLVEAFRSVVEYNPQARLLIAGRISEWSGDEWARDLRDRVVHDPALCSRVIFLGFVENVPELLRGREVLVAPSLVEEGLPLVVMEAKAAGIPSIVFPSGGLPEMIQHDVDGFVCRDKSIGALVEALRSYLDDPSVAVRHGAAARVSLERLGVPQFASRWLAVYERTT